MKCKILFSADPESLGKAFRHWLNETNRGITIRAIAADANYYGYSVSVVYQEAAGPQYHLSVLASRKHDALEQQVNQVFAEASIDAAPMVAMGSNQLGHCMFLLWADAGS